MNHPTHALTDNDSGSGSGTVARAFIVADANILMHLVARFRLFVVTSSHVRIEPVPVCRFERIEGAVAVR